MQHRHHWSNILEAKVLSLQRTRECFEKIEADPELDYDLPKRPGMLAGQILKYCFDKADQVLAAQAPCIYKFGYTHCAHFRWHNTTFGYKCAPDKWEKLLVIYAASETISPAYVEGALIQRFKGFLPKYPWGSNTVLYTLLGNKTKRYSKYSAISWPSLRSFWLQEHP